VQTIDLYCPEPIPSAQRQGWIAPATLSEQELLGVLESLEHVYDARLLIQANRSRFRNLRLSGYSLGTSHPRGNTISDARWTEAEADAQIAEVIEWHRARGLGFRWQVYPFDQPADLRERLEQHGLLLAGDEALMVRAGLGDLDDIPVNPAIEIEELDGSNDESIEGVLQIISTVLGWTPEQLAAWRPAWYERLRNPAYHQVQPTYLARLAGKPVANAQLELVAGVAYMGGASTLPEYRGQRIYSTLLRRRLEAAHERGYKLASVSAQPMSRRVVARYGFKEYGRMYVYGWMPVMDAAVIRSLVSDD
jgi:GNAT superfamily N-acetyltransferase